MLRRRRFAGLVERQLELFASDERKLLEEAATADEAWTHASSEDSEERYGEYQLVVDAIAERLYDLRETYAAGLEEETAARYRAEFDRAARRRFPRFASFLED
jgi:hypothetical protein